MKHVVMYSMVEWEEDSIPVKLETHCIELRWSSTFTTEQNNMMRKFDQTTDLIFIEALSVIIENDVDNTMYNR